MDSKNSCEDFPTEMKRPVRELHESLADLRRVLNEFNSNYNNIKSEALTPLLKAKLELTNSYAINSLFWIYLTTKGINPYEHRIKGEIIRLKGYMERVQQIEDKHKQTKLDTNAANRFIRSALWEPNDDTINDNKSSQTSVDETKRCVDSKHNPSTSFTTSSNRKPPKKKKKFN
jgi:exosome complex protein LRP1